MDDNKASTNIPLAPPTPHVGPQEHVWTPVGGGVCARHVLHVGPVTMVFRDHKGLQYFD